MRRCLQRTMLILTTAVVLLGATPAAADSYEILRRGRIEIEFLSAASGATHTLFATPFGFNTQTGLPSLQVPGFAVERVSCGVTPNLPTNVITFFAASVPVLTINESESGCRTIIKCTSPNGSFCEDGDFLPSQGADRRFVSFALCVQEDGDADCEATRLCPRPFPRPRACSAGLR